MIARVSITTATRAGKTFLKRSYFTPPLKLANVTEDKSDEQLKLMLVSSSPGILDGDEYLVKIELEEGCSLRLQTQSYQRLFEMKKGASQQTEVLMCPNSSFCYLPHPVVPHRASDFTATNKIYLSNNCKLIWGEVLTCGRKLNGEVFEFTRYQNRTEIFLNGKLVVKENLLVRPSIVNLAAIGQLEGFTHQGSLIYIEENVQLKELSADIDQLLSNEKELTFGVSALPVTGIIIRLLGYKGEQLFRCLQMIAELVNKKEAV